MSSHESKQLKKDEVNHIPVSAKRVALTFDDGPNIITTPLVLDKLEKYGVTATFFLVGQNISDDTKIIMERALGLKCELGNHSWTHSFLGDFTEDIIKKEIEDTNYRIFEMVGVMPKFFRPPYLAVNDNLYHNIKLPFIGGLMCNDWEAGVNAAERASIVLNNTEAGDIIVMHDMEGNTGTVEALDEIIPGLLEKGYQFVTVSQLFELSGIPSEVSNKLWRNIYQ